MPLVNGAAYSVISVHDSDETFSEDDTDSMPGLIPTYLVVASDVPARDSPSADLR